MIREGGRYLADSLPILERLHDARGALEPGDVEAAHLVDRSVFAPMVGIYYGTDPQAIAAASDALTAALGMLAARIGPDGWFVGGRPGMVEATLVPLWVRLEGLRALGFEGEVPDALAEHGRRVLDLPGGRAVRWSEAQQAEFVWRFETYRARRAARG